MLRRLLWKINFSALKFNAASGDQKMLYGEHKDNPRSMERIGEGKNSTYKNV